MQLLRSTEENANLILSRVLCPLRIVFAAHDYIGKFRHSCKDTKIASPQLIFQRQFFISREWSKICRGQSRNSVEQRACSFRLNHTTSRSQTNRLFDSYIKRLSKMYHVWFTRDVTTAMFVSVNKETAAMLVSQSNPQGMEFYSYAMFFFCFD